MEQMTEEKIARINELYRKQKSVGLTFEEKREQKNSGRSMWPRSAEI